MAFAVRGGAQERETTLLRLEDLSESGVPPGFDLNQRFTYLRPNFFGHYEQSNVLRILEYRDGWSERFREVVGSNLVRIFSAGSAERTAEQAHCREQGLITWSEISGTVHVASLDQPARRWQWTSELSPPIPMEFSPDGKLLVLKGSLRARSLEVREVTTGRLVLHSDMPMAQLQVLFADAGRKLAAASTGNDAVQVLFWDLTRPEQPPLRFSECGDLSGLSVSPDGRWVAVGSHAGIVVLYNAATMELRNVLHGTLQAVFSVAFSPNSRSLVSGGGTGGHQTLASGHRAGVADLARQGFYP